MRRPSRERGAHRPGPRFPAVLRRFDQQGAAAVPRCRVQSGAGPPRSGRAGLVSQQLPRRAVLFSGDRENDRTCRADRSPSAGPGGILLQRDAGDPRRSDRLHSYARSCHGAHGGRYLHRHASLWRGNSPGELARRNQLHPGHGPRGPAVPARLDGRRRPLPPVRDRGDASACGDDRQPGGRPDRHRQRLRHELLPHRRPGAPSGWNADEPLQPGDRRDSGSVREWSSRARRTV